MIGRFEGEDNLKTLIETLKEQRIIAGNEALANAITGVGKLREIQADEILIQQGHDDTEIYLILAGSMKIIVNGHEIGIRGNGNHVGEMSLVQPTQQRAATVQAAEKSVVVQITKNHFDELAATHPDIWRLMAKELARRLLERNKLVSGTKERVRLFIISSVESLEIARTIQDAFAHDPIQVVIWTDGVFKASDYTLEALERELDASDFAIAIVSPDDVANIRGETAQVPRDNVIFELGMFIGRLGRKRSFLVEPIGEEVKLPSDLRGITTVPYRFTDKKNLPSDLGPACNCIRRIITDLGPNN